MSRSGGDGRALAVLELFSGIGGWRLALDRADPRAREITAVDASPLRLYRLSHPTAVALDGLL